MNDEMVGFALLFPFAGDVDDEYIPDPGTERPERCSFGS